MLTKTKLWQGGEGWAKNNIYSKKDLNIRGAA